MSVYNGTSSSRSSVDCLCYSTTSSSATYSTTDGKLCDVLISFHVRRSASVSAPRKIYCLCPVIFMLDYLHSSHDPHIHLSQCLQSSCQIIIILVIIIIIIIIIFICCPFLPIGVGHAMSLRHFTRSCAASSLMLSIFKPTRSFWAFQVPV